MIADVCSSFCVRHLNSGVIDIFVFSECLRNKQLQFRLVFESSRRRLRIPVEAGSDIVYLFAYVRFEVKKFPCAGSCPSRCDRDWRCRFSRLSDVRWSKKAYRSQVHVAADKPRESRKLNGGSPYVRLGDAVGKLFPSGFTLVGQRRPQTRSRRQVGCHGFPPRRLFIPRNGLPSCVVHIVRFAENHVTETSAGSFGV